MAARTGRLITVKTLIHWVRTLSNVEGKAVTNGHCEVVHRLVLRLETTQLGKQRRETYIVFGSQGQRLGDPQTFACCSI